MLNGRPLTAVIPVRGGSRGIPGKNLYRLRGMTLLERTILRATRCARVDRTIVSTDCPEMHAVAQRYGVAAPALRPAHLATDGARSVDVVADLVETAEIPAGWIVLLQVTSPLCTTADLDAMLDAVERAPEVDAAVSVQLYQGPPPGKLHRIENDRLQPLFGTATDRPRQAFPDLYAFNGAFFLVDRDVLLEGGTFVPPRTLPFVMPPERSANLDTPMDLEIMEAMLASGRWTVED